jgi:hypothetical protein
MASLLEALKQEFFDRYLDENGLGLLQDEAEERLSNARNENGVLFASYGYIIFKDLLTENDKARGRETLRRITHASIKGLLHRHPNNDKRTEAHDNYDGAVALDILCEGKVSLEICAYGEAHGWSFANTKPNTFSWKQLRQGGSIAYYKIGAGLVPYPLEALWLWGGMVFAMLWGWESTHNLAWQKVETLPIALDRQKNEALWGWVKLGSRFAVRTCQFIDLLRGTFKTSFTNYFSPKHVFARAIMLKYTK